MDVDAERMEACDSDIDANVKLDPADQKRVRNVVRYNTDGTGLCLRDWIIVDADTWVE